MPSAEVRQPCTSIALIAAVSCNWVIGNNDQLPWAPIKQDMAHFRSVTSFCPVIMGRRSWESLPVRFRP